ncbi:MAG: HPr family phosphocarrier protein [Candidatus Krumholzibacteria bacterium]|nr:HPr family phosphocarrier protein [Candidatus Krumholzibacteria bacterium]
MVSAKVKVINKNGIHIRRANDIQKTANMFRSVITIKMDSMEINAKSILGIAGLGAECGTELEIKAVGEDEADALASLVQLFENNFYGSKT